jgi:hypothetical protein
MRRKLSGVLLATAVLGAALVATSEPAAAYHHGWRYGWHRAPFYSEGWGSTYPYYSFGYNYPYSVTMAAAATAPVVTGRSVATGQDYYSAAIIFIRWCVHEGFTMRRERLSLTRKGLSRPRAHLLAKGRLHLSCGARLAWCPTSHS